MSCGRNRRRPTLSSIFNSRLHDSSSANSQSTQKNHPSSFTKKTKHSGNLLKQTSHADVIDVDRFRILDDEGHDLTPRRITDHVRINIQQKRNDEEKSITQTINKRNMENQEQSVSEKSIVGTTNFTTSTSRIAHTDTLFSTGDRMILDIGTRIILESEHLLSKTSNDRTCRSDSEKQEVQAKFLPGLDLQWIDVLMNDVVLSETDTIFILNLNSIVVSQDDNEEYDSINEKNKIYIELCKNRQGNDVYIERGMQTFNDLSKHEHIVTDSVWIRSQQSWANKWDMHDSIIEAGQYQGTIYRQYLIDNNENLNNHGVKFDEHQHSSMHEKLIATDSSKVSPSSSSQNSSALFSQDSLVKMTPSKTNCFDLNNSNRIKLPEIDVDAFIIERILNLNVYHKKHLVYRGFASSSYADRKNSHISAIKDHDTNLSLERLWHYTSPLTHGRNVSCLCWNEQNHNLLAVGYGKFQYNDDKEAGLVCCWNVKNLEFPERYYETNAGVTSLSFSLKHPNLLAVGLFDGTICVFDLNENNTFPIVDTTKDDNKHSSPVWQIAWNERDRSSKIDSTEVLVSISSDGRITQWILRKEFEATDLMRLKHYNASQMTCHIGEKNGQIYTNGIFSGLVSGLCFDIRANDKTIYLCGTNEGFIHRCSTIYNEKYLETYTGHMSPVYKVHWSPFVDNIFLSASADWTVRLWMVGYNQACMVFSSSDSKMFFDAIWSPKSSTVFCCVSETTIQIWDLSRSILDPVYVAHCAEQVTLTSIAYATDSDCIVVGTSDGAVWIYRLENLASPANANDLMTIVDQTLLSHLDSVEKTGVHRDISLASTQSPLTKHD